MQICDRMVCSGCGACSNVCPIGCIDMREDEFGFTRPAVDDVCCIACGRCRAVCPVNSAVELRDPRACYAAYRLDDGARADSASGGVAAVFYEQALRHQTEDAAAYGVVLDERMRAEFFAARRPAEAEGFKGSKYVQADPELVYQSVAENLTAGRRVLFIAMPCQIAACLSFLKARCVQDDGLITVDMLCHGVSPWKYLSDELEHLKKWNRWSEIRRMTFRSNRPNKNFHMVLSVIYANSGSGKACNVVEYNRIANADPYFKAFLEGVSLRDSCYQCRYACPKRAGDITIGDFIGLGSQKCSPPFVGKSGNASLILVNTSKGDDFLKRCADRMRLFERPYQEACEGGKSLQRPFPRHPSRDAFLSEYIASGFVPAMETLFGQEMRKARMLAIPKNMAHWVAQIVGVDPRRIKEFFKKREQI